MIAWIFVMCVTPFRTDRGEDRLVLNVREREIAIGAGLDPSRILESVEVVLVGNGTTERLYKSLRDACGGPR
ncbi:MAG: hypothetical protein HC945_00640 [Nitrosarchaeum sp.]|nr:hypothetical protein [Nitrosarchaeum sp.]